MKTLPVAAIALLASVAAAAAQTIPDLKGTWSGQWKSVVYGHNPHHPGRETLAKPPRVREVTFTFEIEGQDGRLVWGKSWSNPNRKDPFAAYVAPDGKTIIGSDTDGSLSLSIGSADRIEGCYTHTALGPTRSIVASCGIMQRSK